MDERLRQVPSVGEALTLLESLQSKVHVLSTHAFTSALTGLLNRNAYDPVALSYNRNLKEQAAVVFMDLTGFKKINDTHGQLAGDVCIRESGKVFAEVVEAHKGIAFHASGDEFIALLGPANVADFKVRFESRMSAFPVRFRDENLTVHANAGVAMPDADATLDELKERAEKACKYGKRVGQCVLDFSPEMVTAEEADIRWRCDRCSVGVRVTFLANRPAAALSCPVCQAPYQASLATTDRDGP